MLRFAITGSGQRHLVDQHGNLTSGDKFDEFCESLGSAIARAGHQLVVLSDLPGHADTAALKGYLTIAQGNLALPPILVTRGSALDPENSNAAKFIAQRSLANIAFKDLDTDGEYPFNRVGIVEAIDVLIVIGGQDGAKQLVEIAYALKKTLVPISSFGGVAERVWNRLEMLIDSVAGDQKDALSGFFGSISHSRSDTIVAVADQLQRKVPKRNKRPVTRILSIDGGGIRGIIPAIFCQAMENWSGKSIHELFDFVAGTSTGGILALGFASPPHGISASQLVNLYESHGNEIFGSGRGMLKTLVAGPKYDGKGLERALDGCLPRVNLSQAILEVFITAYDLERGVRGHSSVGVRGRMCNRIFQSRTWRWQHLLLQPIFLRQSSMAGDSLMAVLLQTIRPPPPTQKPSGFGQRMMFS
jgi:hypothetical protein